MAVSRLTLFARKSVGFRAHHSFLMGLPQLVSGERPKRMETLYKIRVSKRAMWNRVRTLCFAARRLCACFRRTRNRLHLRENPRAFCT